MLLSVPCFLYLFSSISLLLSNSFVVIAPTGTTGDQPIVQHVLIPLCCWTSRTESGVARKIQSENIAWSMLSGNLLESYWSLKAWGFHTDYVTRKKVHKKGSATGWIATKRWIQIARPHTWNRRSRMEDYSEFQKESTAMLTATSHLSLATATRKDTIPAPSCVKQFPLWPLVKFSVRLL